MNIAQKYRPRWLAAGLLSAAVPAICPAQPADFVIINGNVLTVDPQFRRVSAVAIREGVFVAVGSDAEIRQKIAAHTRVIDAGGRTIVPGLIETHVHATGAARGEAVQPFVQLHSIEEIREWVRRRAREARPGEWIRLPRVDVTRIRERRLPTREDLDAAAPNHPAVFTWTYGRRTIQALNTAAMRAANINRDTQPPPNGKIHRDASGEPTGTLEDCRALLQKFLPRIAVADADYHDALVQLLRRYNEIGITSITQRNGGTEAYRAYEKLKAQGRLPVRVTVTFGLSSDGTVEGTEKAIRAIPFKTGDGDDWLRVGPLKLGVDGGILYGTAYMREPYGRDSFSLYGISDPKHRGHLHLSPEKLSNMIRTGHRMGWQLSSHVTGDAALDAVLDAVETANADSPIAPRRYNLIHAYFPHPESAQRAARLGVCADTQPAWYYKDGDALAEALGPRRLDNFIGLQIWRKADVKVALNSDHMEGSDPDTSLNPYNPFLAMQVAVTRKTEGGRVFGADQKVSRSDALRMVTIDAAWLSFDEKRKGSIEVGKLADLAVLTDHLMTCPEENIKNIRSRLTVVGGRIVHEL